MNVKRKCWALAVASLLLIGTTARTEESPSEVARQVDQQLNADYQFLMQRLSPQVRERFRQSERDWLVFRDLDNAAIRASRERLGLSKSQCENADIWQIVYRVQEFGIFANGSKTPADSYQIQRADDQLNEVYRQCIAALTSTQAAKLRQAQRAWITFRDGHRGFGLDLWLALIEHRTKQLNLFYVEIPVQKANQRVLDDHWSAYLKEIQSDNTYPNWSEPPYALFLAKKEE
jgi:uncharacterized protein YecT (DUF1311 family)